MPTRSSRASKRRTTQGFSLVELLIVVAIILVILAVAIPALLRARISANESAAVSALRSINSAESTYSITYGSGYATDLGTLGGNAPCTASATNACLVDDVLSSGQKQGYNFIANGTDDDGTGRFTNYWASTAPISYGQTGIRRWCIMSDGFVRERPNIATTSAPLTYSQCQSSAAMQE